MSVMVFNKSLYEDFLASLYEALKENLPAILEYPKNWEDSEVIKERLRKLVIKVMTANTIAYSSQYNEFLIPPASLQYGKPRWNKIETFFVFHSIDYNIYNNEGRSFLESREERALWNAIGYSLAYSIIEKLPDFCKMRGTI